MERLQHLSDKNGKGSPGCTILIDIKKVLNFVNRDGCSLHTKWILKCS